MPLVSRGQTDRERGTSPVLAVEDQSAPMFTENLSPKGESHTPPDAGLFGRKKREENILRIFRLNAHAGVTHGQAHSIFGFIPGADDDVALGATRLPRVQQEIEKHLLDLPRPDDDR